jgi:hypothetical protein
VITYIPAQKMGRLTDGRELGQGSVFHAVPWGTPHYGRAKAACGTQPGRRSGGWHVDDLFITVSCKRCAAKVGVLCS